MRHRLSILFLLFSLSAFQLSAATVTNAARVFTGGARVRSITFRSLTGNQDVEGTISVAQDGVTRGITNNFINLAIDAGAYEFQFEGSSHKNRCVIPPGDGTYSLLSLTTNLTQFAYTNALLGRLSSRVLPGTNVVFLTNNYGRFNETLTINSSLAGGSGGTMQTNISYTAVTNEPWVEQISGFATNLVATTNNSGAGGEALHVYGSVHIQSDSIPLWIEPLLNIDGDVTAMFMRQNSDGVVNRTRSGSGLTNLNATELRSGTVAAARTAPTNGLNLSFPITLTLDHGTNRWLNGPKVYRALLTQSGTDAPVATVLENTLGGAVVWTRLDLGSYAGTLAGAFPPGKVFSPTLGFKIISPPTADDTIGNSYFVDANTFGVGTQDSTGTPTDSILVDFPVEILVYP